MRGWIPRPLRDQCRSGPGPGRLTRRCDVSQAVGFYGNFDLLIIDEFGFENWNGWTVLKPPICSTR